MVNKKEKYNLTDLEWEIVSLVAKGNTEKEIAEKFRITVHNTRKNIKSVINKTKSVNKISAIYTLFKPEH